MKDNSLVSQLAAITGDWFYCCMLSSSLAFSWGWEFLKIGSQTFDMCFRHVPSNELNQDGECQMHHFNPPLHLEQDREETHPRPPFLIASPCTNNAWCVNTPVSRLLLHTDGGLWHLVMGWAFLRVLRPFLFTSPYMCEELLVQTISSYSFFFLFLYGGFGRTTLYF